MQTKLIIIAVASALAAPAIAAPYDAPYMLKAVHADFEAQQAVFNARSTG
jgi:hypothetical protein